MDRKKIEARLATMQLMKETHLQDLVEFDAVIECLKKQLSKMPKERKEVIGV